jgi:hypothetical protein
MARSLVFILLLFLAAPAFAKPYPVPCSDLWSAVTDTLGNAGNYKIVATDSEEMKASFIVVGALFPGINALFLKPQGNGCELQIKMGFTETMTKAPSGAGSIARLPNGRRQIHPPPPNQQETFSFRAEPRTCAGWASRSPFSNPPLHGSMLMLSPFSLRSAMRLSSLDNGAPVIRAQ